MLTNCVARGTDHANKSYAIARDFNRMQKYNIPINYLRVLFEGGGIGCWERHII
jgi:hypothetical protein